MIVSGRLLVRAGKCLFGSGFFILGRSGTTPLRAALGGGTGINARLLDGYAERDGRSLFEGREIEVRPMENAGD